MLDLGLPKTWWLVFTNIALGVVVVLCLLTVVVGLLYEVISRLRRRRLYRAELNHDMQELFGPPHRRH